MIIRQAAAAAVVLMSLALSACAPSSYAVKNPVPSGLKYEVAANTAEKNFSVLDERRSDGKVFSFGTLPAELKIDGKGIDPVPFFAAQVQAELASRGLPAKLSSSTSTPPVIHLKDYRMENLRTSGYSPFVTLTYISADVETPDGTRRIATFVTRGKVPVWSFEEIIDPTFNQPLGLGIQEFASKLANSVYGYRASDETVKALTTKVNGTRTPDTFLSVYALGFTNHPAALDTLIGLTKDEQEYVRQAAIASLGNLGATSQFPLLKTIYQDVKVSWQDRCVALKSIADLGTPESKAFIAAEAKTLGSAQSKEMQVMNKILALYL